MDIRSARETEWLANRYIPVENLTDIATRLQGKQSLRDMEVGEIQNAVLLKLNILVTDDGSLCKKEKQYESTFPIDQ